MVHHFDRKLLRLLPADMTQALPAASGVGLRSSFVTAASHGNASGKSVHM